MKDSKHINYYQLEKLIEESFDSLRTTSSDLEAMTVGERISLLGPEPWLYVPGVSKVDVTPLFAFSEEERVGGEERLAKAPHPRVVEVQVYDLDENKLEKKAVATAMAAWVKDLVWIRAHVDQAATLDEWKLIYVNALKRIRRWCKKGHITFTNPGNSSLVSTREGVRAEIEIVIDLKGRMNPNKPDSNVGRYGPFAAGKTDEDSRLILSNAVVVTGKDDDTNHYQLFDSMSFIRKSSLVSRGILPDKEVVKVFSIPDLNTLADSYANGNADPTLNTVAIIIPDFAWPVVMHHAGLDPEVHKDSDMLFCNRKDVKFSDAERIESMQVWKTKPTLDGRRTRVTSTERQWYCMTEEAKELIANLHCEAADKLAEATIAAASNGGNDGGAALGRLAGKLIEDMTSKSSEERAVMSREELEEERALFNSISRVVVSLECGLPTLPSEAIQLHEALIRTRIKGIRFPGSCKYALSSGLVPEYGVVWKLADMLYHKVGLGDIVNDIRYPNVGSSITSAPICGHSEVDGIFSDPAMAHKLKAEDNDGDVKLDAIVRPAGSKKPIGLVVNESIRVFATKNTDDSSAEIPTLATNSISSSFGKLNIGITDSCFTRCLSSGHTNLLSTIGDTLQKLIDMAKKIVRLDRTAPAILKENKVPPMPSAAKIAKGNISSGAVAAAGISNKKAFSFLYPLEIYKAWKEKTSTEVGGFFTEIAKHFVIPVSLKDSAYTVLARKAFGSRKKRERTRSDVKFSVERIFDEVNTMRKNVGLSEWVYSHSDRKKFWEHRNFDPNYFESNPSDLILGEMKKIVERSNNRKDHGASLRMPHLIHRTYREHIAMLQDTNVSDVEAYEVLHKTKDAILYLEWLYPEVAGDAMQYLFYCICGATYAPISEYEQTVSDILGMEPIDIKSVNILASLPVTAGHYNLKELISKVGYSHELAIHVVKYSDLDRVE